MGRAVERHPTCVEEKGDAPCWGDRRPRGRTLFLISVGLNTWGQHDYLHGLGWGIHRRRPPSGV